MDIHRCRFVQYPSSSINALAFSHPSTAKLPSKGPPNLRLAVGRANGDIEIWNPQKGAWYQETILQGGKDRSIEGLVWTHDPEDVDKNGRKTPGKLRLFSIGYSSAVTEWDLALGRPIRHSAGNYGEIWCMAAQPRDHSVTNEINGSQDQIRAEEEEPQSQNIAVGCADGSIVLLSTADEDLRFSRILARSSKKKSRVLSITFQDRNTIIAGHADSTIRIYDVRNKQQMRNMTIGAGPRDGPKEVLVWSVKCLGDRTIVSGDSTGTLSFWDGKTYSLLQRVKGHEADILDIAVSVDGQSVFSGGMDRRTTVYRRSGGGQKLRWAKIAHQRFHKHDVKAMATFETKSMSVLVSGGPDAAPIIVPIKEFGRENHRALSSLPHQPILRSSDRNRLMISWWEREICIWKISKNLANGVNKEDLGKGGEPEGRKLVGKIMIQGEESITSVELSRNGKILVVATMANLKLFRIMSKNNGLRVQRLEAPPEMIKFGAKSIQISPDHKWLAVVRPTDTVQLYRITEPEVPGHGPLFLQNAIHLKRIPRAAPELRYQYGTLGKYNRSIIRLTFSADSRILAVGDLSGFLDTWVLEGREDVTQRQREDKENHSHSIASASEGSDDDSDRDEHSATQFGQHWIRNPSASLLIKLPSPPLVLSFRPSTTQSPLALMNGSPGIHPTRHTPHPYSHELPNGEDRLFVLTAENQVYEFDVLYGIISHWSRRNPPSAFPQKFRDLKDRAMGVFWDVRGKHERVWLYGVSWLWMFDLSRDLPKEGFERDKALTINGGSRTNKRKRKRPHKDDEELSTTRRMSDTGAGSNIPKAKLGLGIGSAMRKIKGAEGEEELINLTSEQVTASDDEEDLANLILANEGDSNLDTSSGDAQLEDKVHQDPGGMDLKVDGESYEDGERQLVKREHSMRSTDWHTFKYRPILGIVPIGNGGDDEQSGESKNELDGDSPRGLEVALVERPLWDVDLPPQYYGNQEWDP